VPANETPAGGRQHQHRELTRRHVLLVAEILVGGDDGRKTADFRRTQQVAILQPPQPCS